MSDVTFDINRWDHWLLIVSFTAIAIAGLWMSWQWQQAKHKAKKKKTKLSRPLFLELHTPNEIAKHSVTKATRNPIKSDVHSKRYKLLPTKIR